MTDGSCWETSFLDYCRWYLPVNQKYHKLIIYIRHQHDLGNRIYALNGLIVKTFHLSIQTTSCVTRHTSMVGFHENEDYGVYDVWWARRCTNLYRGKTHVCLPGGQEGSTDWGTFAQIVAPARMYITGSWSGRWLLDHAQLFLLARVLGAAASRWNWAAKIERICYSETVQRWSAVTCLGQLEPATDNSVQMSSDPFAFGAARP